MLHAHLLLLPKLPLIVLSSFKFRQFLKEVEFFDLESCFLTLPLISNLVFTAESHIFDLHLVFVVPHFFIESSRNPGFCLDAVVAIEEHVVS